ncbi:MAG: glutamine--tRNA ligase [Spirochaetaceae bacterium]|jgi:glutaminyl-tRNA synthetase|nr:glutamine--tRNA ligase [Spirochaetaceae bacterium]
METINNSTDFISEFIQEDISARKVGPKGIHTRFPPEPNGWLHIGHCKAFYIDFSMAERFGGKCNLRFDDTNPEKEDQSYVEAIKRDIHWMGYHWEESTQFGGGEYYASDYYDYLYDLAIKIIKKGKAYVDDLSEDEISVYRGTAVGRDTPVGAGLALPSNGTPADGTPGITIADSPTRITPPGKNSPYRDRSIEENLDLFARMKAGEFPDGSKTLRAKIDMAHPNLIMRDPVMYRIRREKHYRTGDAWCIYPMYDFQHPLSDAKEGITHSLCSLEYEIHRPLYDWFISEAEVFPSRQIEFARLNLSKTVMSKRHLLRLVQEKYVSGWDDPRMPTIAGLRRRGYTPEAIRSFVSQIGIAKTDSMVDIAFLEYCLREDLNKRARRAMAVLKPLKLIIDNWDENAHAEAQRRGGDTLEYLEAINNPENADDGTRQIPFGKELWIERDDFEEVPPPKYFRLFPGNSVRLRYAYIVTCTGFDKDANGNITAVHCNYDPATKGGNAVSATGENTNKKVKGTIHWVQASTAVPIKARIYDYLFNTDRPMELTREDGTKVADFIGNLNENSLEAIETAYGEPCLAEAKRPEDGGLFYQFERLGYFVLDTAQDSGQKKVFNKTIGLRDTWGKIQKKG